MNKIILIVVAATLTFSGCVMNKLDTSYTVIQLDDSAERLLTIDTDTGDEWSSQMHIGPFIFNVLPQMAVWLENAEGELVQTLYVTGADFTEVNHSAKNEDGEAFYSECLPFWSFKLKNSGSRLPCREYPYPDTLTSATPMADFSLETSTDELPSATRVFAELNKSDDVNAVYTEDNNDWAGQPSIIYSADISCIEKGQSVSLSLVGHGGSLDENPGLYTDLTGIDSAAEMIEAIKIIVE